MNKAYLSIGTNIGDKTANIQKAVAEIAKIDGVRIIKKASDYKTEPVGMVEQDYFVNTAVKIETTLTPYRLLNEINRIEAEMGRVRELRWGPRIIDIDIIFFGKIVIKRSDLIIPHREYKKRNFVLVPLMEIIDRSEPILKYLKNGRGEIKKISMEV